MVEDMEPEVKVKVTRMELRILVPMTQSSNLQTAVNESWLCGVRSLSFPASELSGFSAFSVQRLVRSSEPESPACKEAPNFNLTKLAQS